jgi:hypothetical protein
LARSTSIATRECKSNASSSIWRDDGRASCTLDHVAEVSVHFEDLRFKAAFDAKWKQVFSNDPPALIQLQAGSANHTPLSNAYFVLDVIATAPEYGPEGARTAV